MTEEVLYMQRLGEPENADVPVVIISAIADRIDTSGAKEFIRKPLEVSKLLEVVAKYC